MKSQRLLFYVVTGFFLCTIILIHLLYKMFLLPRHQFDRHLKPKHQQPPIDCHTPTPSFDVTNGMTNYNAWSKYPLADIIKTPLDQWKPQRKIVCKTWPMSIGCTYMQEQEKEQEKVPAVAAGGCTINYPLLDNIVPARRTTHAIGARPPGVVVIHLRLGDVFYTKGDSNCWDSRCTSVLHSTTTYVYPQSYYQKMMDTYDWIGEQDKVRVILVGNPYHLNHKVKEPADRQRCIDRSLQYLKLMVQWFQKQGICVQYAGDDNRPDEDFETMANADYFVRGGGGYSTLAGKLVVRRGGKVIDLLGGSNGERGKVIGLHGSNNGKKTCPQCTGCVCGCDWVKKNARSCDAKGDGSCCFRCCCQK